MKRLVVAILVMGFFKIASAQYGSFVNGFEQVDAFGLWTNVNAKHDTAAYRGNHVCHIDASQEYGLGVAIDINDELAKQNIRLSFEAAYRFVDADPAASVVVSISDQTKCYYWCSYPISGSQGEWFKSGFTVTIPADYMPVGATIKIYVWNNTKQVMDIDEARFGMEKAPLLRFLPKHQNVDVAGRGKKVVDGVSYHYVNKTLSLNNSDDIPVTKGLYAVTEAIIANDTMTFFARQWRQHRRRSRKGSRRSCQKSQ